MPVSGGNVMLNHPTIKNALLIESFRGFRFCSHSSSSLAKPVFPEFKWLRTERQPSRFAESLSGKRSGGERYR